MYPDSHLYLYRGDRKGNNNIPEWYFFDGIRSKAFGKGDPAYIKKEGLLKAVRQHIQKNNDLDRLYGQCTDFLSFSSDRDIALFWMRGRDKINVEQCRPYEETNYLFTLALNRRQLSPVEGTPGLYLYRYVCNPGLKEPNVGKDNIPDLDHNGFDDGDLIFKSAMSLMYGTKGCEICQVSSAHHFFFLVDGVEYITHFPKEGKDKNAFKKTQRAREWLLLPADPMDIPGRPKIDRSITIPTPEMGNLGARVHRADFWSVDHFIDVKKV